MQPNPTNVHELKLTGGAQIGRARTGWPFAKLTVTRDKMQLSAGIIGSLIFRPSDVLDVVPYGSVGFSSGVLIRHRVANYKETVVFTSFENSMSVIKKISATGFLNNRDNVPFYADDEIVQAQQSGGFPMKVPAAVALVMIWNLLCIPMVSHTFLGNKSNPNGFSDMVYPVGFLFSFSVLTLIAKPLQTLILKPGRTIADIRPFVLFLMAISAIMLAANLAMFHR